MKFKKIITSLLAASMILSSALPSVFAEEPAAATRGEVVQMLLVAVDDYNPTVQKTDIIKGYEDGQLHEERAVTRAEALVMLKRAFGELPVPTGHNARVALKAGDFTDIPAWAEGELESVFNTGIVAGTAEGVFSPDELVTREQMDLFIKRVFALYGTNLKDDFYAAVNKEALNSLEIKPGRMMAGTLYDLSDQSTEQVSEIINEITTSSWEKGTKEYKIAALYNSILDTENRNKTGIEPIKKYLDLVDTTENINDLIELHNTLYKDICLSAFFNFSITVDMKDSTKYMLHFGTPSPTLQKELYLEDNPKKDVYITYLSTLFELGGESKEEAKIMAQNCFEMERVIAEKTLDVADQNNVDIIYNVFTMQQIRDMFPDVNIDSIFETTCLKQTDKILITDVERTKAFAGYFNNENIDALKAYVKLSILAGWGAAFNQEFVDASDKFNQEFLGTVGSYTDEERAAIQIQSVMADYIGEIYVEKHFSEQAKKDVEKMVHDIIAVYRKRLQNNDWMSEATKEKAIHKLDSMGIKIGYPDEWDDLMDAVEILAPEDGGTYFTNMLAISKANVKEILSRQDDEVDKTDWIMYPYTVNACYSATSNDITFPAAILQAPMYDVNASYEQNLGGIGYIIAHEITHAFDNNGAKFDADGNATDWWTEEDYAAFNERCEALARFYDGQEAIPGVPMNGTLTLSENVADNGAVSCITEIVSGLDNPDYKALYESIARCWASTTSRDSSSYMAQVDVHSADKLRVNRVIVNCPEFYEAFGITEKDGMYVAPEDRVKVW